LNRAQARFLHQPGFAQAHPTSALVGSLLAGDYRFIASKLASYIKCLFALPSSPLTAYSLMTMATPLVGIIMGSTSDWETMQHTAQTLDQLGVAYEKRVISAHRTPKLMYEWGLSARDRGLKVVIAGAGGAAHLAGVAAALTPVPVLGVPMESALLKGLDSLLSMVQMPGGVPVATFAIGKPGAINAALFAAAILALSDAKIAQALDAFRAAQAKKVEDARLP
jgi:5-(carboxyamino)imidazole ribonucleotide mutase